MAISQLKGIEMTKLILGAFLATIALHVAPAAAEPAATAEGDLAIARAFWGREPTGCSSITFTTNVIRPEANGEATQPTPGEPPIPCTIAVREVDAAAGLGAPLICLTALHEYGHLLGEGHSTDPLSVMYPEVGSVYAAPICGYREETPEGQAEVARRQAWQEWRELRSLCEVSRGPFRPRCWRLLHQQSTRLHLRFASQLTD